MRGDEIRANRESRGWTQQQLAQRVGVGQRTIGNWERGETIPKNRAAMLEQLFAHRDDESGNPLAGFSETLLLTELLRRAVERRDG